MDVQKIAITVAPVVLICGLIGIARMQVKLPEAVAAAPPPLPRNVAQADQPDEGDDVPGIDLNQAPDAVRAAIAKLASEKNITNLSRETDEGVTVYIVEYKSEGKTHVADISDHGDVFQIDTQVKPSALPEAVSQAIKQAFPSGTIREANAVQSFFYEIEVMIDGKAQQVKVDATGDIQDNS